MQPTGSTCLEVCPANYIWNSCTVIKVEVCDQHQVDCVQVYGVQERERSLSRKAGVYPTVKHYRFAPANRE